MLYLVATPIGNLDDFTYRAVKILQEVNYVLSEDTRKSKILLNHYQIKTPLRAFHKFNEKKSEELLLHDLKNGLTVALISDAGTPLISDPGSSLVNMCIREQIPFTSIPGACSPINALVLSGLSSDKFQFVGFLPRKKGQKETVIKSMLAYRGSSIFFESPHRLLETLDSLKNLCPERSLAVVREMTKTFEEVIRGTPDTILEHFKKNSPRGEFVLVLEEKEFSSQSIKDLLEECELSPKMIRKIVSTLKKGSVCSY